MKPSVTVCIPTYNGAAYLAACLHSVSAQTFSNFEVVVVDDCSSDESASIAKSYAQRDSRIRVLVNDATLGLVGNRNRCVQLSQGEWVKFVFQDDIILPDCLTEMLATAARTQMPIVTCARDFIFEPGSSSEDRQFYREHRARVEAIYRGSAQRSARQCSETALRWIGGNGLVSPPRCSCVARSSRRMDGSIRGCTVLAISSTAFGSHQIRGRRIVRTRWRCFECIERPAARATSRRPDRAIMSR